jgi:hypothetical protein
LFDIVFSTVTGTYPLEWNDVPDNNCEYQNALIQGPYNDNPTVDFYINGFISDLSGTVSSTTDVICKGANDGTVTLAASGGSFPNLIYKLTKNSDASFVTNTTGAFTGVAPGTYTATVIDGNYPYVETLIANNIVIIEPATALTGAGFESYRVRCKGESNGQATMNASGGWGGILYSIDGINYQVNNYFDALSVGVYTLYAKDAGGCVITSVVNITEPIVALSATGVESKVVTCKGGNNGEITLTGFNGWGGYLYSKNNLDYFLTPTLTGFAAGTHTVYVKDDGGCTVPVSVTVTEPADPLAGTAIASKMVTCWGYSDGEITVTPTTGGWGSYEYSQDQINWQTSNVFGGYIAGSYSIYVRDAEGCIVSTNTVTITQPDQLVAVITGTTTVCYGDPATVTITGSGGTLPYTFRYKTATGSPQQMITSSSIYFFTQPYYNTTTWTLLPTTTDANGCTSDVSGSAVITVNPLPVVTTIDLITDTDPAFTSSSTLGGNLATGYTICVDPVVPYHYLGISSLTNTPVDLEENHLNEFFLVTSTLSQDFYDYWDAKGVDGSNNAFGWELDMWEIINGNEPMFYMEYDGTDYTLIDGLQYLASGGTQKKTLRITGNYPQDLYTFTGTVLDQNGCTSLPFNISLQMNSSPVVHDITLVHSTDQTTWDPVAGDFATKFELCVDAMEQYHYLDVAAVSSTLNPLATSVMNEFFLNTTSLPGDFYTYWNDKGVNISAVGGWEEIMWNIISGNAPMFYMEYDGTDYILIDGLQFQAGAVKNALRISGDYPAGTYTFTGTVQDINGCVSSPFNVLLDVITTPQPDAGPDFTVCNSATYKLQAVQSVYNGIWTYTGPGIADIFDEENVSSTVTVDVAGAYIFTWTETNGICEKSDVVTITFLKGTLADDYNIAPKANVQAVSGAPVVARYTFNLPVPDVNADANIIMDGLVSLSTGTFPAGMKIIEARRVAPITTTWFKVVDGDLSGRDHIFLSEIIGMQNPLFNNELNNYNWVITTEDANGTTGTLDMNFALVTYIGSRPNLSTGCYAILDQINWTLTYDEALISAPDAETCDGNTLLFSASVTYPVIDNVDDNMEIVLDAKITLTGGTFNAGSTLLWGYNLPAANTSNTNVDGKSVIYLSEIVGLPSFPMTGHGGTDVWNFAVNGLNPGIYNLHIEAIARITVVEPPMMPLQIPSSVHPAPVPGDYFTYEYAYTDKSLTLTVHELPTITLDNAAPKVCNGDTEVEFGYSATTNGADEYSIVWGTLAAGAGFSNVSNIALPATPIVIAIPGSAPAGIYEADLTVINSVTGCISFPYPIEVHVPDAFTVTPTMVPVTCFGHNDGQAAVNVAGSWGGYQYLWDDPASQTTNPAVNLYADVYTVVITDAEGCSTTATVTVTQPNELEATVTAYDITCHGLTDGIIEITNPTGGYGFYEYRLNADAWSVTPTFTGLAAGTYDVQIRDAANPHCWLSLGVYTIVEPPANVISGAFNYPNLFNTPLTNVTVNLVQSSIVVYTTTTDPATGLYSFPNVCNGTYEVVASTGKPFPGAINATDATQVNNWSVAPTTIPVVQYIAGDVVVDGWIDPSDASLLLEYFVTQGNPAQWPLNDWVFWHAGPTVSNQVGTPYGYPQITVSGTQTANFLGLVTGDFNKSFTPGNAKTNGSIEVTNLDGVMADGSKVVEVPVTAGMDMDVTAISLILNYPVDKVEVVGVTLGTDNTAAVPFHAANGELRIGYFCQMPMMRNSGDVLLTLHVRPLSALTSGENATFTAAFDQLNELAGANYQAMTLATLNIPVVQGVVSVPEVTTAPQIGFGNFPNPFNHATTFAYNIPVDGKVTLSVYDMTGRMVQMVVDQVMPAGQHSVSMDNHTLGAGIYMANLTLTTDKGVISRSIRIVSHK